MRKASLVEVENIEQQAAAIKYVTKLGFNVERHGKLIVHILAAKDIIRTTNTGDMFVCISTPSGEQQKTLPCKDAGDAPVWYERIELSLKPNQKTAFAASLYAGGWAGEVLIGKLVVDYSAMVAEGRKVDAWLPLRDKHSSTTGQLHLNISFVDAVRRKNSLPEAPPDLPMWSALGGVSPREAPAALANLPALASPPDTSRSFRNRRDILLEPAVRPGAGSLAAPEALAGGLGALSALAAPPQLGPPSLSLNVRRPSHDGPPAPHLSESSGVTVESSGRVHLLRPSLLPAPPLSPRAGAAASPRFRAGRLREASEEAAGASQIRSNSISRTHGRARGEAGHESPRSGPLPDLSRSVPDLKHFLPSRPPGPVAPAASHGGEGADPGGGEAADSSSDCSYES